MVSEADARKVLDAAEIEGERGKVSTSTVWLQRSTRDRIRTARKALIESETHARLAFSQESTPVALAHPCTPPRPPL
jgi:hypothetical protein